MTTRTDIGQPAVRLRRWVADSDVSAAHLNEAVDAVQRMVRVPTSAREVIRPDAAAVQVQQFVVVSEAGDYLRCRKLDGPSGVDVDGGIYYVAKPYLLRRSPFDGTAGRDSITFEYTSDSERTATNADDETEDQAIVPSYVAGDVVYGVLNVAGLSLTITRADGAEFSVRYLDMNADGRAWAQV